MIGHTTYRVEWSEIFSVHTLLLNTHPIIGIQQVQIIYFKIDFESIFKFDFLLLPWQDSGHTADVQLQLPAMTACANTATHCYKITVVLDKIKVIWKYHPHLLLAPRFKTSMLVE